MATRKWKIFDIKNPITMRVTGYFGCIQLSNFRVEELAGAENTLGLILPPFEKGALFDSIQAQGALPRKTFSIGHAKEKRYYLEARKIKV